MQPPAPSAAPLAKIRWPFVCAGYLMLGAAAYIDNTRGPILPVIMHELQLDFSSSAWFLSIGYAAATAASLIAIPWLGRCSERSVSLGGCSLAILCGLWVSLVNSFALLMVLAAIMGASIAVMGSMCNVLVMEGTPKRLQPRLLSGLHAVYGLASMGAAQVVAKAVHTQLAWPWLYAGMIPLLIGFAVYLQKHLAPLDPPCSPTRPLKHSRRFGRMEALVIATFAVYVGGEATCTMWLTTYLVSTTGLSVADAAGYTSGFFFMMLVTRLLCFAFASERNDTILLILSLVLPIVFFGVGYSGHAWAFPLVGFAGPFFPLFLGRVSRSLPGTWRAVTMWTIATMQVTLGALNLILGSLADHIGMRSAYLGPFFMLCMALLLLLYYFKKESTLTSQIHP